MSSLAFELDPVFSNLPQHLKISAMIVYYAFLTCLLVRFVEFHYVMWQDSRSSVAIRAVLESWWNSTKICTLSMTACLKARLKKVAIVFAVVLGIKTVGEAVEPQILPTTQGDTLRRARPASSVS